MKRTKLAGLCAAAAVVLVGAGVWAQSVKVYRTFKGQIIISDEPIATSDDDKEMTATLKKAKRDTLKKPQDATNWPFHFIAFLSKKAGTADISLFFYESGKKEMAFYRDLQTDPETSIVAFELEFGDDDGVKAGQKYDVTLGRMDGKAVVALAKAKVTFK